IEPARRAARRANRSAWRSGRAAGQLAANGGAASGGALDFEPSARDLGALVHADHPEMAGCGAEAVGAHAVVGHAQQHPVVLARQLDVDPGGVRMLADVGQRLLADAKEAGLLRTVDLAGVSIRVEPDLE